MFFKKSSNYAVITLAVFSLLSSCSHYSPAQLSKSESWHANLPRSIANETSMPVSFEDLVTIKTSTNIDKSQNVIELINELIRSSTYHSTISQIEFELILDQKMSADEAFKIMPVVENQSYKFKIYYSQNAVTDLDAFFEFKKFLWSSMSYRLSTSYSLFEIFYNAKEKDLVAMSSLAKLRFEAASQSDTDINEKSYSGYVERMKESSANWKTQVDAFGKLEKEKNKKDKVQALKRKEIMDVLDKATDDQQFKTLVAKNDRKGTADLLRKYLPWEEMPPFEKLFWEKHLEIMANPVSMENRVMVYRGIDDDMIHEAMDGGKKLGKDEAIRQQKIFLMSTIMTKNQGSWNRRLRSLTSMYEKEMGSDHAKRFDITRSARISNMFLQHSKRPLGSPFLSTTPALHVAEDFGQKRVSAYFVDPRMLYFNFASAFMHEFEFLLPLITFPDELAAVYDSSVFSDFSGKKEAFLEKKAIEKLEKEFGKGEGEKVFSVIKNNTNKFFKPSFDQKGGPVKTNPGTSGLKPNFFKDNFGADKAQVEKAIKNSSDMQCTDIIQLFWK